MAEFKLVLSRKDGKSFQKVIKDQEAKALLKRRVGDKISGKEIGMECYELAITGGSDKCGFPMRKGILQTRQRITIKGKGVGFSGKDRNKKKQKGLRKKKTVCGERISSSIVQINMKILKEGKGTLGKGATAEEKKEEVKEEAPKKEKKEEVKEEKPVEKAKPEEKKEEKAKEVPKEEAKEEPKPKEEKKEG